MKITPIYIWIFFFISYTGFAQQIEGKINISKSKEIDRVISEKKASNENTRSIKGYKIQLFYGSEKKAYEVKEDFENLYYDIPVKIIFSSPDWKVQAGNFITKLQADKILKDIKKDFPGAIVLKADIYIKSINFAEEE